LLVYNRNDNTRFIINLEDLSKVAIGTYSEIEYAAPILVQDTNEIFYGLYYEGKLIVPMEYTEISYNGYCFVLRKGATESKFLLETDGNLMWLD
jgi:hypothetical protein